MPKFVIYIHQCGVGIEIAHIVVGIFGIHHHGVALAYGLAHAALGKKVAVPLALRVFPHIVHYRAGYAFLGIVIIEFGVPAAAI